MGIRIPTDASQNVQAAFRDIEQEIEDLKAGASAPESGADVDLGALIARIEQLEKRPRLNSDKDVFVASGPQHSAGLVPDPGGHASSDQVLREDGTWGSPNLLKLADEDQNEAGVHDIYTLPGALHVSGPMSSGQITTNQLNAWDHPGLQEAHGGAIINPNGILATINVIAWQAPYACHVVQVRGYRVGGTSASINARLNGASNHLSSALSLTSADTWMDGGAVQNATYAALDKLEIMLTAVVGSPTQIGVQVIFRRA